MPVSERKQSQEPFRYAWLTPASRSEKLLCRTITMGSWFRVGGFFNVRWRSTV
jgi:hypothetical protein